MTSQSDTRDLVGNLGDINSINVTENHAIKNLGLGGIDYNFISGVVREVISDPEDYLSRPYYRNGSVAETPDGKKITIGDAYSGAVGSDSHGKHFSTIIANKELINFMPMNSIFVTIQQRNNLLQVVAFPFFPPHISMPVNPGEQVWLFKQEKMYF